MVSGQFRLSGQHHWHCRPTRWYLVFCSSLRLFRRDTQLHYGLPGLGNVKTIYRDPKLFSHLPGPDSYREAKNKAPRPFASALGRLRRHLIKPPAVISNSATHDTQSLTETSRQCMILNLILN